MTDRFESIKGSMFDLMRKIQQSRPMECHPSDGVTCGEGQALHIIMTLAELKGKDEVRPGIVAEHLHVTPSALSQIVKNLEAKGLVERARGVQDSRSVILRLTEEGKRRARVIDERWSAQMRRLVEYVGYDDFEHLLRTVGKMLEVPPPNPAELERLVDVSPLSGSSNRAARGEETPCA